jgi:hypothetical protein
VIDRVAGALGERGRVLLDLPEPCAQSMSLSSNSKVWYGWSWSPKWPSSRTIWVPPSRGWVEYPATRTAWDTVASMCSKTARSSAAPPECPTSTVCSSKPWLASTFGRNVAIGSTLRPG